MSAPLVVNTRDGACWTRRTVTSGGIALYALADVCVCPEFVMATLAELAEHGIAGSADVLPVPVGPEPQVDADRAKAPWGRDEDGRPLLPMGAHWTDVPELVDQTVARIQARVDEATSGHWYMSPIPHDRPGTVSTRVGGVPVTVGQVANMLPADRELVLHAHDDLSWCLEMLAKFRTRVAELLAERHVTNEALDDAPATDTLPAWLHWRFGKHGQRWDSLDADDQSYWEHHAAAVRRAVARNGFKPGGNDAALALGADGITRQIAPTQVLREVPDGEHAARVHHTYRVGRDLPETGGAK